MRRQATCAATVACLRWIYSLIVYIPAVSSASATGGHSHSPFVVRRAVIPVIILLPGDGIPLVLLECPLSPPISHSHIKTPTARLPCTAYTAPATLTLPSSPPSHHYLDGMSWLWDLQHSLLVRTGRIGRWNRSVRLEATPYPVIPPHCCLRRRVPDISLLPVPVPPERLVDPPPLARASSSPCFRKLNQTGWRIWVCPEWSPWFIWSASVIPVLAGDDLFLFLKNCQYPAHVGATLYPSNVVRRCPKSTVL